MDNWMTLCLESTSLIGLVGFYCTSFSKLHQAFSFVFVFVYVCMCV